MTYSPQMHMQHQPAPQKKSTVRWGWVVFAAVGMLFLLAFVFVAVAPKKTHGPSPAAAAPPVTTATAEASTSAVPTPTSTAPVGPATTVGPGTYKVGEDMAPGAYKATCEGHGYWARMRTDNPHDIITNDLKVDGGPMRFTTKAGEYVEISGGCTFTKSS
jgi:hypothetical protein